MKKYIADFVLGALLTLLFFSGTALFTGEFGLALNIEGNFGLSIIANIAIMVLILFVLKKIMHRTFSMGTVLSFFLGIIVGVLLNWAILYLLWG